MKFADSFGLDRGAGLKLPTILCLCLFVTCSGENGYQVAPTKIGCPKGNVARRVPTWGRLTDEAAFNADGFPVEVVHGRTGIKMVYIPAGSFAMGSGDDSISTLGRMFRERKEKLQGTIEDITKDERPIHSVIIPKAFYLAKYETTNSVFKMFRPEHKSYPFTIYANGGHLRYELNSDMQPVVSVAWSTAAEFCRVNGLRLPTEAEWEWAARAGSDTIYPWGNDPNDGMGHCNVADKALWRAYGTHAVDGFLFDDGFVASAPVGSFAPNRFGVYDMIGNANEWCSDSYGPYGSKPLMRDPRGTSQGEGHVFRGGCWYFNEFGCRSAKRERSLNSGVDHGFRVAHDI